VAVTAIEGESAYLRRWQPTDGGARRALVTRDHSLSRNRWMYSHGRFTRVAPTGERLLALGGAKGQRLVGLG
jgi:hypothetical protein